MGRFRLHQDGSKVRHVGNAMVAFDRTFVAPLFVAHRVQGYNNASVNVHRGGRRQTVVPELEDMFWDPPEPSSCQHGKKVKRRLERFRWKMQRRADRDEKLQDM